MRHLLICAATLALAAPAVSQAATPTEDYNWVRARAYGLDLSNWTGASVMLHRLDNAAMEVCGASSFSWSEYRRVIENSRCHAASLRQAVHDLDAPTVTALYHQKRVSVTVTNE